MMNTAVRSRSKSKRKPLGDISNSVKIKIDSKSVKKPLETLNNDDVDDDSAALDRLLLVHSDISVLIHQMDELVVQALKMKKINKKGGKEIESFANVLSQMLASLKPWVPRFEKALSSTSSVMSANPLEQPLTSKTCSISEVLEESDYSPEESKTESLVSPSPLVCWRAQSTTENVRQLFMLTPLHRPKTLSSKLVFENIIGNTTGGRPSHFASTKNTCSDMAEGVAVTPAQYRKCDSLSIAPVDKYISPSRLSRNNSSMIALTPCLKMSPPKSCVLLEPESVVHNKHNIGIRKSTPFPVGIKNSCWSQDSESSGSEVSECPKILRVEPSQKLEFEKKVTEEEWSIWSPPKSCILMEPSDDELLKDIATDCQLPINTRDSQALPKKPCNQEIEMTPMWKEPESSMRTGKLPGENTLKKELWTKFEAATTSGFRFNVPVLQATASKGFLDRLEEASCDEASP